MKDFQEEVRQLMGDPTKENGILINANISFLKNVAAGRRQKDPLQPNRWRGVIRGSIN